MKLLIIASAGDCPLALAMRAKADGHKVRVFIRNNNDGSRNDSGDGIIERVPHWEPHMEWADLIFLTDNNKYIHALELYANKGYPIFGCNVAGAEWEQNREVGTEILKRAGIKTIGQTSFTRCEEAIAHVTNNPKRYVSKPIGDGDKTLSYVSKTAADMIYMLQYWKKKNSYKGAFILQDFHAGIEMGVGGWFGLNGFSKHWCESFEFKKLMNDELGVTTGEQGTIVRYTESSKLADEMLKPLEGMLHGIGYTGYIDVNCIIDKNGQPWPLEFTNRPGWPLFNIQQHLHRGDSIEWMLDSLSGKDTLKVYDGVGCGVVISIPDYPYCRLTKKECSGYPLFNITEEDLLGCVYPSEVQMGKAPAMIDGKVKLNVPTYVTAGDYVGTVCGRGESVEDSRTSAYGNIKKYIEIPNSVGYRTDIGCRLKEQLPELHSYGYVKGLNY